MKVSVRLPVLRAPLSGRVEIPFTFTGNGFRVAVLTVNGMEAGRLRRRDADPGSLRIAVNVSHLSNGHHRFCLTASNWLGCKGKDCKPYLVENRDGGASGI